MLASLLLHHKAVLEQFGFNNILVHSNQDVATCLGIDHKQLEEWG
jgi:hypothetical protein